MAENTNDIKIIDLDGVKRIIANAKKLDAETLAAAKQYADTKIEEKKYELPVADENTLGGVKIGSGITKNPDGTISIPAKTFKTINNESIEGEGNITIDLGLYVIVTELPTTGIDDNKVYLVQSTETVPDGELNTYVEWIHVSGKWEKMGEYKSAVDLSPYAKTADVTKAIGDTKTELTGAIATAKSEAVSEAATAAAGLYMNKTDLAATYQAKADMPTFTPLTDAEIDAAAAAAVAIS